MPLSGQHLNTYTSIMNEMLRIITYTWLLVRRSIPGVQKYVERSLFVTFIFENILLDLRELFTAGIAVHKFSLYFVCTDQWVSGQRCMEVRKAIIPDCNVMRMKNNLKMTMFWEMTLGSKLLNQFRWSWYHSFQKTIFYLIKWK